MNQLVGALLLQTVAYTAFMAAYAWEALRLSGTAGGPALAFAVSSLTTLCLGPFLGVWVDRLGASRAYRVSQGAAAFVMLSYGVIRYAGAGNNLAGLFAWGVAVSTTVATSHPAVQAMAQTFSTPATATVIASRTGVGVALGFVVGYIFGGRVLDALGITPLLLGCALMHLIALFVMPRVRVRARASGGSGGSKPTGGVQELIAGIAYLFQTAALRNAALAYVLCYTVFHTTTALLPSFAKFVLGVDAASFGVLRGSWSAGSAAGSLGLTALWGARRLTAAAKFLPVAALGAALVVFAQSRSYQVAVVSIGAVGIIHSLCRAFLDGVLIEVCDAEKMGRVRSNVNSLLSAVSLAVFASASFVQGAWLHLAFSAVGVTVSVCCLGIYVAARRDERQRARAGAPRENFIETAVSALPSRPTAP